jgi:hypothetical protein
MMALGISCLLGAALTIGYGLLDLFTPGLTIRWQVRSTTKHQGTLRGEVGGAFQQWTGTDPDAEPWDDLAVRRKVRFIGTALFVIGAIMGTAGIVLITKA